MCKGKKYQDSHYCRNRGTKCTFLNLTHLNDASKDRQAFMMRYGGETFKLQKTVRTCNSKLTVPNLQ